MSTLETVNAAIRDRVGEGIEVERREYSSGAVYVFVGGRIAPIAKVDRGSVHKTPCYQTRLSLRGSVDAWVEVARDAVRQADFALHQQALAGQHDAHTEPVADCPSCGADAHSDEAERFREDWRVKRFEEAAANIVWHLNRSIQEIEREMADYRTRPLGVDLMPGQVEPAAEWFSASILSTVTQGFANLRLDALMKAANEADRAAVEWRNQPPAESATRP